MPGGKQEEEASLSSTKRPEAERCGWRRNKGGEMERKENRGWPKEEDAREVEEIIRQQRVRKI